MRYPMASLLEGAYEQARRVGSPVVGVEHFLLAIVAGRGRAREALVDAGVVYDDVRRMAEDACAAPVEGQDRNLECTVQAYQLMGRAEGIAISSGVDLNDSEVDPEHLLIAMLWGPSAPLGGLLEQLDIDPAAVVAQLRGKGVEVPTRPPPAPRPVEWGEAVLVDREDVGRLTAALAEVLPPGTELAVNADGERAWVRTERGIDLARYLAAVSGGGAGRLV